ncbi:hypothetical protein U1Q18_018411 [Sarracenia purpurea var. burkii]
MAHGALALSTVLEADWRRRRSRWSWSRERRGALGICAGLWRRWCWTKRAIGNSDDGRFVARKTF